MIATSPYWDQTAGRKDSGTTMKTGRELIGHSALTKMAGGGASQLELVDRGGKAQRGGARGKESDGKQEQEQERR